MQPKLTHSVHLPAPLFDKLKAVAAERRVSLRTLVAVTLNIALFDTPPLRPALPRARPVVTNSHGTPVAPPTPDADAETCLRCGHPKENHFVRGCKAGCACSDKRYQAPL